MAELALALAAGLATVASPCILPMLPVLLGASLTPRDPLRPLCIVTGFVASFAATALAFGASARVLGISQASLRHVAIGALLLFGALALFPRLFERVAPRLANQSDWYLLRQLNNFRTGVRGRDPQDFYGGQMARLAGSLGDERRSADLVAYIGTLRGAPAHLASASQDAVAPRPTGHQAQN